MKGEKSLAKANVLLKEIIEKRNRLSKEKQLKLYHEFKRLIRIAAYGGNASAQFELGNLYESTSYLHVNNPDFNPRKAMYWYERACGGGHAEACNSLAFHVESLASTRQDYLHALKLYKQSAKLGSKNGEKNLRILKRDISAGGKYNNRQNKP